MQCVNHPQVETRVTCSACGDPICPDCMVYTAVGAKCPTCARMPKSALVRLKPQRLALTVVAGLGSAAVGGYVFGLALSMIGFFSIIIAFGLGYGVGELVSWASGRYHSTVLGIWAAACAVLGILFPYLLVTISANGLTLSALLSALLAGSFWKLIWMAAAAFGAWRRNA
jgi:hypothetical protein